LRNRHRVGRESIAQDVATSREVQVGARGNAEYAYQQIRQAILDGRYKPGERLIEQRISDEFDLSRTPVREALRRLEAEGLVLTERHRGSTVRPTSDSDVDDLYELRARLESMSAERAALRATTDDIAELDRAIQAFDDAIRLPTNDVQRVPLMEQMNVAFHDGLSRMAAHSRLEQLLANALDMPSGFQAMPIYTHEDAVTSNQFHRWIRDAVASRDPRRAGRLMFEHILMGRDVVLAHLQAEQSHHTGEDGKPSSVRADTA
jgi:DNA-binding GntR family transcriptional regulator